ncbi:MULTISPECIES: hypothetical protein [Acidobacteriaceae]|uniref:hypothetical protein n=1 Tax=Acidobacteriaceae TaxID=204434 RepID=UPI00131DA5D9|nr:MULTISPECIES: hypothetical protein [Acidobacteriaceae]MDW5267124.1 hypothetical protein [Edaphobacter sp.]
MSVDRLQLGWAALIGIASVAILAGIASIERFSSIGIVLLPGTLLAALFFPQGIESDHGIAFLVFATIFDSVLFALVALVVLRMRSNKSLPH